MVKNKNSSWQHWPNTKTLTGNAFPNTKTQTGNTGQMQKLQLATLAVEDVEVGGLNDTEARRMFHAVMANPLKVQGGQIFSRHSDKNWHFF